MEYVYLGVCLVASFGLYYILDKNNKITLFLHNILPQKGRNAVIMIIVFAIVIIAKKYCDTYVVQAIVGVVSGISIAFFGKFKSE